MADEVRIEQVEGFRVFTEDVTRLRDNLTRMQRPHRQLPVHPPAGTFPHADVSAQLGDLTGQNEQALGRLAGFTTAADRGMAGLAFVSGWIGTNFPGTDAASGRRMAGLVDAATAEIPPPPAGLPSTDPRFVSPVAQE